MRREDMRKMLLATRGKVFTLATLDQLIEHSRLREFLPRPIWRLVGRARRPRRPEEPHSMSPRTAVMHMHLQCRHADHH